MCRGIYSWENCDAVDCLALFTRADIACSEDMCSAECKVAVYWAAGSQVAGGQTDAVDYCGSAGDSGGDFMIPTVTYDPVFDITTPVLYTVGITTRCRRSRRRAAAVAVCMAACRPPHRSSR
eukprot:SAG22_NODE_2441_length_2573_cov_35.168957_1_plen_122_part_00